jgi:hypothetical protein
VLYPNLEQSERPEPQGGVRPNRGRPRRWFLFKFLNLLM